MELVDVLDKNGNKTNEVVDKDKAHKEGIYHPVVHLVVLSEDRKRMLLQKRCSKKKILPNMWDVAAAGHISSGEDNLESIKREFNEELGLDSEKYDFNYINMFEEKYDDRKYKVREYAFLYIVLNDIDINDIKIQEDEVSDVKWFSKEEYMKLTEEGLVIKHKYGDYICSIMN